mgnify:FL=1
MKRHYALWRYEGGNWVYDMSILADNPSAALESAGGNYSPSAIPQCITSGNGSNPSISGNILAGYTP